MDDNDEIQREIDSIRNDTTHPFNRGDPRAQVHMENLYKRLHGVEPAALPERRTEGELTREEEAELKEQIEQQRRERGKSDRKAESKILRRGLLPGWARRLLVVMFLVSTNSSSITI